LQFNQNLLVNITSFYSKYRDLVDFDSGPPPKLINRSEVSSKGLEANITYKGFNTTTLYGNFSYTNTKDHLTDSTLLQRPKLLANFAAINKIHDNLTSFVKFKYVDSRKDSAIPTGEQQLASYLTVDLGLDFTISSTLSSAFEIRNILDQQYYNTIGNPGLGLTPYLRLEFKV
jgi:outer membrane receptor protein involved in Fe transport